MVQAFRNVSTYNIIGLPQWATRPFVSHYLGWLPHIDFDICLFVEGYGFNLFPTIKSAYFPCKLGVGLYFLKTVINDSGREGNSARAGKRLFWRRSIFLEEEPFSATE
jgi:hypothetical protein